MSRERYITDSSKEIYNTKAGVVWIDEDRLILVAFKGKQTKPYVYTKYKSINQLKMKAIDTITSFNVSLDRKDKELVEKRDRKQQIASTLKVGSYLVGSWGYSMTIVNSYRVKQIKGSTVIVESVGNKVIDGVAGFQGSCIPNVRSNGGEDIRATVTPYGVKVNGHYTSVWDGVSTSYFNHMD